MSLFYGKQVLHDSAISLWKLDDPTGATTALDSNPTQHFHATITGGVTLGAAGVLTGERAMSFNGTTGWLGPQPSASLQLAGPFSIEAWIKTSANATQGILMKWDAASTSGYGLDVILGGSHNARFFLFNAAGAPIFVASGTSNVCDGNWHHVVGAYDQVNAKIYIDGVLEATTAATAAPNSAAGTAAIGAYVSTAGVATNFFSGQLQNVALYVSALTIGQVRHHQQLGRGSVPIVYVGGTLQTSACRVGSLHATWALNNEADTFGCTIDPTVLQANEIVSNGGPVGYWPLHEQSGTVAYDSTAQHWHGTITGGVTLNQYGTPSGPAMLFNGTTGWIAPAPSASIQPAGAMSIECWLKTSTSQTAGLMTKFDAGTTSGYGLGQSTTFARWFAFRADGTTIFNLLDSTVSIADGAWHHVVGTYDQVNAKLYVDGIQVQTVAATLGQNSTAGTAAIGAYVSTAGTATNFYAGLLAEVALYTAGLTPTQVAQHASIGRGQVEGLDLKVYLGSVVSWNQIFGGTIDRPQYTVEGRAWSPITMIAATDYTRLLNRRYPIGRFSSVSASTVATSLITNYTSGFTSVNVAASLPSISIDFDGDEELSSCLSRICTLIGGYWYVDYTKDLHLFLTETTVTPDTIDGSAAASLPMLNPPVREVDLGQIRTRVLVMGGGSTVTAPVPVGGSIIPVQSAKVFSTGTMKIGPQIVSYTGVSLAQTTIAIPVGTWTLTPRNGFGGSLPFNTVVSYKIVYCTPYGETTPSAASSTVNTGGTVNDRDVVVGFVPTAGTLPSNIIGVKIYRSLLSSGGAGPWKRCLDFSTQGNAVILASLAAGNSIVPADDSVPGAESIDPPTTNTAGGDEILGSTTSGSTAIGATAVSVAERGHFNFGGGAALVTVAGRPFLILYTGMASAYGAGQLTGVPATGFGSVVDTIPTGTQIQNVPVIAGVTGVIYPINAGDAATLYVVRNDTTAQAALALREGGDGIHEYPLNDSSLSSVALCNARGDAELTLFKNPKIAHTFSTRDTKCFPGRSVLVNWGVWTGTHTIQRVDLSEIGTGMYTPPLLTLSASNTKCSLPDLLRQLGGLLTAG